MLFNFGGPLKAVPVLPLVVAPPRATRTTALGALTLLSWNLLAPPYKRFDGKRAHESEQAWTARAAEQVETVRRADADVVGLQEFWCGNPQFVSLWRDFAEEAGYAMHVVPRVNGKEDGCCMLVRGAASSSFSAYEFDDWGSRIVQVAELAYDGGRPLRLVHTHLTFPHASAHDPPMRRAQARKLSELVRALPGDVPACVFGDINGDVDDPAVTVLTSLGGLRAMPSGACAEREPRVSHIAHTGAEMACDLALCRGPCHVDEWSLGGTCEELRAGALPSDHRALRVRLVLGDDPCDDADAEAEWCEAAALGV